MNLRRRWNLYRIKRELRRYSPEHQRWILERAKDPRPLKPIPPKPPRDGRGKEIV